MAVDEAEFDYPERTKNPAFLKNALCNINESSFFPSPKHDMMHSVSLCSSTHQLRTNPGTKDNIYVASEAELPSGFPMLP